MRDDDLVLQPTSGTDGERGAVVGFAAVLDGDRIGTVALLATQLGPGRGTEGRMTWNFAPGPGVFATSKALNLAMKYAFETLGWTRVEARVGADDPHQLRLASMGGLRREGVARQPDGSAQILHARLINDHPVFSKEGFIALLNAGLPRKRIVGQGIWRDESDRILLCELTYKAEWDLPGGVIEVNEAPARGLARELHEELGVDVEVQGLVTVNWMPAWRQWDDASTFVFDLGTTDSSITETMTLQPSEIAAVHWCTLAEVRAHATSATIELLEALDTHGSLPAYREAPLQPE